MLHSFYVNLPFNSDVLFLKCSSCQTWEMCSVWHCGSLIDLGKASGERLYHFWHYCLLSGADLTTCPWFVRINGSSFYKIASVCVWKGGGRLPSGSDPAALRRWVPLNILYFKLKHLKTGHLNDPAPWSDTNENAVDILLWVKTDNLPDVHIRGTLLGYLRSQSVCVWLIFVKP